MEMLMESEGQRPRSLKPIHLACYFGNLNFLKFLVNLKVNINSVNSKNDTPILFATRNNHIDVVQYTSDNYFRFLLRNKASVDIENDKGSTPLYWAVRYQYEDLVKLLVCDGKAMVSTRRKLGLETPITMATSLGNLEILKTLIENGADVNTKIKYGMKPIHVAAYFGHLELTDYLVNYNISLEDDDDFGNTPLLISVQQRKLDVFAHLLTLGANGSHRNKRGKDAWTYAMELENDKYLLVLLKFYGHWIEENKIARSSGTFSGSTYPLHLAASKGATKYLRMLFESKLKFNEKDSLGNTFIHTAAFANQAYFISTRYLSFRTKY
ncbi:serine/threonine-protein phosphatase 6 regulatory ankyrin repeat subunit C-like [Octopus sinensis]|uniref:Serine/threonine-protein phosphatase 6 regulatory ankyrin repeat subunit C-like n=1 Tax=Octopus sinensis TaxID=2607531 RepID=A0A6P7U286_9MOLL|nr:serine/threonine-protein phosphatase 6 regulatory ankyrin repeat subunit C-like [Octopus sinensis]